MLPQLTSGGSQPSTGATPQPSTSTGNDKGGGGILPPLGMQGTSPDDLGALLRGGTA